MPGHYIKILKWLETYARRASTDIKEDWQQILFDDITSGGHSIRVVPMPSNAQGPLIGLCGKTFFCHAGQDQERPDSLFLSRIEPVDRHVPAVAPTLIEADFSLLTTAEEDPPRLDSVAEILDRFRQEVAFGAQVVPVGPRVRQSIRPGAELAEALAEAPPRLRRMWGPTESIAAQDVEMILRTAQGAWRRFRVEKYVRPSLRQKGLLKGTVRPSSLSKRDLQLLRSAFDLPVLNAFARDRRGNIRELHGLLERVAELPIEDRLRATIWSTMLAGASPVELRRSLHEVAPVLENLEGERAQAWLYPLLGALREAASSANDERLLALADEADSESDPLHFLTEWASRLQFTQHPANKSFALSLPELQPDVTESPARNDVEVVESENQQLVTIAPAPRTESRFALLDDDEIEMPQLAPSRLGGDIAEVFSRWVLGLRGRTPEEFEEFVAQTREALARWLPAEGQVSTVAGVLDLIARLRSLQVQVARWLTNLPDAISLESDWREAEEAFVQARTVLGDWARHLIVEHTDLEPTDLMQMTRILEDPAKVRLLPTWIWGPEAASRLAVDSGAVIPEPWIDALLVPEMRTRIERAVNLVAELGEGAQDVLTRIPPPPSNIPPARHFETAVRRAQEMVRALDEVPEEHLPWVRRALARGAPPSRLLAIVPVIEDLRGRVSEDVFERLATTAAEATTPEELNNRVDAFRGAVTSIEAILGTADDASWEQLERSMTRFQRQTSESHGDLISFEHNFADAGNRLVPVAFRMSTDPQKDYGYVSVPLAILSSEPRDLDLSLEIRLRGPLVDDWPLEWDRPSPDVLMISRFDWRLGDNAQIFTFELRMPMRRPVTGKEPLDLMMTARDASSGRPLGQRRFAFSGFEVETEAVPFEWADRVRPEYVIEHPIGPQQRHDDIVGVLRRGGSFAVIAPRRFGKTTLVEFLHERAESYKLIIPQPIVCTSFITEDALDDERLWSEIGRQLYDIFGIEVEPPKSSDLPEPDAFDAVRRAAFERGAEAIVLLIDEAQLFFPSQRGPQKGNRLKDLLERHWSRSEREGMVPVLFGFIGLPSLRERAGTNLMGHLSCFEGHELGERELELVVERVTCGKLITTREAREQLSRQANNLYLLKTLLFRLVRHVNAEQRAWAAYQDVLAAETDLRRDLEQRSEVTLSQYMRDVLNEAEDINVWEPKPCYPVAVALAVEESARRSGQGSRLSRVVARLNRWCEPLHQRTGNALVFTEKRVEEHFRTLQELGILQGQVFSSPIFQAWLFGISRTFPESEEDESAIFRAALQRIRIPDGLEPIGLHSYRFTRDGNQYALRKVRLNNEEQRQRFLASLETLSVIKRRLLHREEGAEFIFQVEDVGIAEGEDAGLEIHEWIEGVSLSRSVGHLNAQVVTCLGLRLSRALRLLHCHGLLHRDINPSSILLSDEGFRPVFIDFGLKCLNAPLRNHLSAPSIAPELRQGAEWTAAGDVYALGFTLESLLDPAMSISPELMETLALCKAESPADRLTADALVERLEQIEKEDHLLAHSQEIAQQIRVIAGADMRKFWFQRVIERFLPRFSMIALGLHRDEFERCSEMATFLDEILAAYPSVTQNLRLGYVKHHNPVTKAQLVHLSIHFLHALRLGQGQEDRDQLRERLATRFHLESDEAMRARVCEGARLIASVVRIASLPEIVSKVLAEGTDVH